METSLLIALLLGCVLGSLAMVLPTIPIFFPVIMTLGYDPVWFGVIVVMIVELGLITPPIGMNVFTIKGIAADAPLQRIFAGVTPFVLALVLLNPLLLAVPDVALWLPGTMR